MKLFTSSSSSHSAGRRGRAEQRRYEDDYYGEQLQEEDYPLQEPAYAEQPAEESRSTREEPVRERLVPGEEPTVEEYAQERKEPTERRRLHSGYGPDEGPGDEEPSDELLGATVKKRGAGIRPLYFIIAAVVLVVVCVGGFFALRALRYSNIRDSVTWEMGTGVHDAAEFLSPDTKADARLSYVTDVSALDISAPGAHEIELLLNGKHTLTSTLIIADTTPPTAQGTEVSITVNDRLGPDALITNLSDAGLVAVSFEKAPEFGTVGDYETVIKLTDTSGNSTTVTSTVHIRAVNEGVTMEAGGDAPEAAQFLLGDNPDATFVTDLDTLTLNVPGEYTVVVASAGIQYDAKLTVTDTTPPVVSTKTLLVLPGDSVEPQDFIAEAADVTELAYTFITAPNLEQTGSQTVTIAVTDAGGNVVEAEAELIISDLTPVVIELRDTELKPKELVDKDLDYDTLTLSEPFTPNKVGIYALTLMIDGESQIVIITVEDTTAPKGESVEAEGYIDHPVSPDRLVKNITDFAKVTVSFSSEPDWSKSGERDVTVILTDESGNTTKVKSKLTLAEDKDAPEIFGAIDRYCYKDEAVSYFAETFASDNCDGDVELKVDSTAVNIHELGTYKVTYSATDSSGNTATASCELTFIENTVTDAELEELAQSVFSEILTDDMDVSHKLLAIHDYVRDHITYNSYSDKTNWKVEAKRGIEEGLGDCFTFYAVAHLLLLHVDDIEIMTVERLRQGTDTMHFWHFVNDGSGWYHFDAFATQSGWRCYMRTTTETEGWSSYFWRYDKELYPEISKTLYWLDSKGEVRDES